MPSSYLEYLQMLTEVFAECVRTLEPGGRIAVNVANLGRKPYRSLSADVIRILDLGLLLRGELVWQKGEGANGSCAWGSFRNAPNPVLRDVSERVIVASKGRFDRARTVAQRTADGLPHESTLMTDEFMALTLDVWTIPPESARRVGHRRRSRSSCPSSSSGSTPSRTTSSSTPSWGAARRSWPPPGCAAGATSDTTSTRATCRSLASVAQALADDAAGERVVDRLVDEGLAAQKVAERPWRRPASMIDERDRRVRGTGVSVSFVARTPRGGSWFFDVAGPFRGTAVASAARTPCGDPRSGLRDAPRAGRRASGSPDTQLPGGRARATPRCVPPDRTPCSTSSTAL